MRDSVVAIVASGAVHFTGPKLLQGENHNLWIPLPTKGNELRFEDVEAILVMNKVAHNVTGIEFIVENGNAKEYRVTFNKFVEGESNGELAKLLKSRH